MHKWVWRWSVIHHTFLFGAAVLSTATATILQLHGFNEDSKKNAATILSACAALAGVVAASGAFDRKWLTCRATRGRLMALEIDLTDDRADVAQARERFKEIWEAHEIGVKGIPRTEEARSANRLLTEQSGAAERG